MRRGTYIGDNPRFKGKTALLFDQGERGPDSECGRIVPEGKVMALFDDCCQGFTYHEHPREDWFVRPITDWVLEANLEYTR